MYSKEKTLVETGVLIDQYSIPPTNIIAQKIIFD